MKFASVLFLIASLAAVFAAPYSLPPDKKSQAYVVGNEIESFTGTLTGQTKQDILDATLFAQFAADKQYSLPNDYVEWHQYFANILDNFGFDVKSFNFLQFKPRSGSFVLSDVVKQIIESVSTTEESAVTEATIAALQGFSEDDKRIQLFDLSSSKGSSKSFDFFTVGQASNGEVVMVIAAFHLSSSQHHSDYLFYSYGSSSVYISQAVQIAIFNPDVYSKFRDAIASQLISNALNLIAEIPLGL